MNNAISVSCIFWHFQQENLYPMACLSCLQLYWISFSKEWQLLVATVRYQTVACSMIFCYTSSASVVRKFRFLNIVRTACPRNECAFLSVLSRQVGLNGRLRTFCSPYLALYFVFNGFFFLDSKTPKQDKQRRCRRKGRILMIVVAQNATSNNEASRSYWYCPFDCFHAS